jgi:hypothetical protein
LTPAAYLLALNALLYNSCIGPNTGLSAKEI